MVVARFQPFLHRLSSLRPWGLLPQSPQRRREALLPLPSQLLFLLQLRRPKREALKPLLPRPLLLVRLLALLSPLQLRPALLLLPHRRLRRLRRLL